MSFFRYTLVASAIVLFTSSAPANDNTKLVGKWNVVQMTQGGKLIEFPLSVRMMMEFRIKPNRWAFVVDNDGEKISEEGSWKLQGTALTTQTNDARKVENIRVNFKGSIVELIKESGTLILERHAP